MKKLSLLLLTLTVCFFTACHKDIWAELENLDQRVTKLEELCKEMNTNITSLQTIVSVLQSNDYITGIVEIKKNGEVIGYTITFGKHDPITIYHGQDGKDGADGKDGQDGQNGSANTPVIGVAQDTDGVYYWTLNGEWLLDDNGNKLPVSGKNGQNGTNGSNGQDGADGKDGQDGEDGKDGADGQDGKDGKDGITPQLKIEDGYWYISYDNGATWTELGKATGEDGQDGKDGADGEDGKDGQNGADGKDGQDGDSMFQSVTQDENYVYFTLADGTVIKITKGNDSNSQPNSDDYIVFQDSYTKVALLAKSVDANNDGEISYNEAATVSELILEDKVYLRSFKEFQYFTGITNFSFSGSNLFEIILPNTIKTIPKRAFYDTNLYNLVIPNGCTIIQDEAFCNSTLRNISIPNTVTYIGEGVFSGTNNIKEFTFPENYGGGGFIGIVPLKITWNTIYYIANYVTGGSTSYYGLGHVGSGKTTTALKEVVFGNKVRSIPAYLCYGLASLTEIILPASLEVIGNSAFEKCTMSSVYCKAITPPILGTSVFPETAIIYVPNESVEAYKTSWRDYAEKIVGYDFE